MAREWRGFLSRGQRSEEGPAPRRPRWPTAANRGPEEARKCSAATPTGLQQRPHPQARAALSSRMGLGQGLPERQHRQTVGQHPTHGLLGTAAPSTPSPPGWVPERHRPVFSCRNTGGQISLCLFLSVLRGRDKWPSRREPFRLLGTEKCGRSASDGKAV